MASVSSLSELPVELINEICSHLIEGRPGSYASRLYGVYALRMACRTLYAKTFHDFCRAAYSTLFVDLTLESLDRLYAISQHSEISKTVRCLYFAHEGDCKVYLGMADERPDTPLGKEVETMLREGFQRVFAGLSNLTTLVVITPFTAVFRRGWRNEVETETLSKPTSREYLDETWLLSDSFSAEQFFISARMLFAKLLDAITEADTKLTSLEVPTSAFEPARPWMTSEYAVDECTTSMTAPCKAVEKIRCLRFPCCQWELDWLCVGVDQALPEDALPRNLAMMPELAVLQLTHIGRWKGRKDTEHNQRIARSLSSIRLPCLATIELTQSTIEQDTMKEFYANHSTTLERLYLHHFTLRTGTCSELLIWMGQNHTDKLSTVHLKYINDLGRDALGIQHSPRRWQTSFIHQSPMLTEQLHQTASAIRCRVWR